jgi:hypothetical protein
VDMIMYSSLHGIEQRDPLKSLSKQAEQWTLGEPLRS